MLYKYFRKTANINVKPLKSSKIETRTMKHVKRQMFVKLRSPDEDTFLKHRVIITIVKIVVPPVHCMCGATLADRF
jgi:hypothetical protein